ncbi:MAG: hypothetical protein L0323_07555, partial [Planctomycetes bacterium]|nr:hypothetical protein [Planctomycetota bacterium]
MRNAKSLFLSATFASLLFTGKPSAAGSERGAVSPSFAVELSSPAGGEFLLRHLESDLYGGPSSFSVPGGEAFLSWLTGGGAVLSAAPTGLDGPPTVLLGIVCNESVTGGGTI